MKEEEEKKIQRVAETGSNNPEQQHDIEAYQLLYKALKKEEGMPSLSYSFAEKTMQKMDERAFTRRTFIEYLWKAVTTTLFAILIFLGLYGVDASRLVFASLASIKWYIIIASFLLIVIDLLDKKYVRKEI